MPNTATGIRSFYFVVLEIVLLAVFVLSAIIYSGYAHRCFVTARRYLKSVAEKRIWAIFICALLPVIIRLALLPWMGVPEPAIMEEFSYLLSGDTFASGRLANPPHPMAAHFETFQVLQHPTYSSIRPPAQGLIMAAGQILTGSPWAGILLSVALMCGSICWMLQAWFPPGWAFAGGLLAAMRLGVFTYWVNSYWGGALTAFGACLVLGSARRIWTRPRVRDACWMGIGIFVLFTTRAFEGLFVLIPVAVMMAVWLFSPARIPAMTRWMRVVAPLCIVLAASAAWIAYYNYRVTGSAKTAPYILGRQERNAAPPFLWEKPGPTRHFQLAIFRGFYNEWEMETYRNVKQHYANAMFYRAWYTYRFYVRPAFTLPLIALLWAWRDRRIRLFLAILVVAGVGQAFETWLPTYYTAPLTGVVFAVVIQCLRHLRVWRWHGRRVGEGIVAAVLASCVVVFLTLIGTYVAGKNITDNETPWAVSMFSRLHERSVVKAQLSSQPGKQLAIVRYAPWHNVHFEWVFNRANIDAAKVVWARDYGREGNQELLQYFHDRQVWIVEPDRSPVKVVRYKPAHEETFSPTTSHKPPTPVLHGSHTQRATTN
jgi:hypothetical protein